jgi:hypothetical protein
MPTVFVPFWRLRQHGIVDEAVRGGSRVRRTDAPWPLPAPLEEKLLPLLAAHGFSPGREVMVRESSGEDGFHFTQ